jgi:tRNA (guanine-N7-)-methyltransferase
LLDNLRGAKLSAIHLLFPDPWPKNKHNRRRFFTTENIDKMCYALKKGGSIFVATDIEEYAGQISSSMGTRTDFRVENYLIKEFKFPLGSKFQTKFESKAYAFNRVPRYMVFKRVA